MNDRQRELARKFKPAHYQNQFFLIEKVGRNGENQIIEGIIGRCDRDAALKVCAVFGADQSIFGRLKEMGMENVTISFGSSHDSYDEKYPIGDFFSLKDFPSELYGEMASSLGRRYLFMIEIKG